MAWGALIGAAAPYLMGQFLGGGRGRYGGPTPDWSLSASARQNFSDRASQIDALNQNLTANAARYSTALGNFQNLATQRFADLTQAKQAGRGLDVRGGAFASALARNQGDLVTQAAMDEQKLGMSNLGTVDAARGDLFGKRAAAEAASDAARWGYGSKMGELDASNFYGQGDARGAMFGEIGKFLGGSFDDRFTKAGYGRGLQEQITNARLQKEYANEFGSPAPSYRPFGSKMKALF